MITVYDHNQFSNAVSKIRETLESNDIMFTISEMFIPLHRNDIPLFMQHLVYLFTVGYTTVINKKENGIINIITDRISSPKELIWLAHKSKTVQFKLEVNINDDSVNLIFVAEGDSSDLKFKDIYKNSITIDKTVYESYDFISTSINECIKKFSINPDVKEYGNDTSVEFISRKADNKNDLYDTLINILTKAEVNTDDISKYIAKVLLPNNYELKYVLLANTQLLTASLYTLDDIMPLDTFATNIISKSIPRLSEFIDEINDRYSLGL